MTGPATLAREYYRTMDADEYDALADLLAPEFVHARPDRTLVGRDRFVAFTRDERPMTDTTHVIEAVYDAGPESGVAGEALDGAAAAGGSGIAVQGRLLGPDGEALFTFVDVFTVVADRLMRLETYARSGSERGREAEVDPER